RDVEMRRVLDIGLPGNRERDDEGMQREGVKEAEHAVLVEQHEAHQDEPSGKEMRDIEDEPVHQRLRETKSRSVPSSPSMSATPMKLGSRKTRILAMVVSNTARRAPPTASLAR